jgi:hypothetical protein
VAIDIRAYLSPTLVLLAFNWNDGKANPDFLGFAIKRTPGFWSADGKSRETESWLPNRLMFEGPVSPSKPDAPSNIAPIQKFMGGTQSMAVRSNRISIAARVDLT